jgi:hypothetical protein
MGAAMIEVVGVAIPWFKAPHASSLTRAIAFYGADRDM